MVSSPPLPPSLLFPHPLSSSLPPPLPPFLPPRAIDGRLRHRVAYGLMVSDANMPNSEGWPMVDRLGVNACDASAVANLGEYIPPIVHYCQVSCDSASTRDYKYEANRV